MKNKKLLLIATAAMGVVALGVAGVGTAAWFTASGSANISLTNSDEKTFTVDYDEFTTDLGSVTVTLTFVEQTSNKDLQLAHYYAEDPEGDAVAGWNQAYRTQSGTVVWNSNSAPTNAYGKVADGHAAAYYRVYRIHVAYTLTADQVTNIPAQHTITGSIALSSTDSSMIFWNNGSTAPNTDGKTSTPGEKAFNATTKAFTSIDLSTSWTGAAGAKSQDGDYICVSCDGLVHTTNDDITGTLSFSGVAKA